MNLSNTWFTSDTHYWHSNVIKYCNRPFSSVEEMNEALIDNWNAVVKDGDTVFHLGDVIFAGVTKAREIIPRLKGNKILIRGNHDSIFKKDEKWKSTGFSEVHPSLSFFSDFYKIHLGLVHNPAHPIALAMTEEWILNGHVHEKWTQRYKNINPLLEQSREAFPDTQAAMDFQKIVLK